MNEYNLKTKRWDNIQALVNYTKGSRIKLNGQEFSLDEGTGTEEKQQIAKILSKSLSKSIEDIKKYETQNKKFEFVKDFSSLKKAVEEALSNYHLLGFDKIEPLKSLEQGNIWDSEKIEPSHTEELRELRYAFSKANDESLDPASRASYMPQPTEAMTANGTYFTYSGEPITRSFVAKPAIQEAGAAKNPKGNGATRDGIQGGEGVIRERIVYVGQELIKVDFGIPATLIIEEKNILLTGEIDISATMNQLEEFQKINPKITMTKFIELIKNGYSVEDITSFISTRGDLSPLELNIQEALKNLKENNENITLPSLVKKLIELGSEMQEIRNNMHLLKESLNREIALENLKDSVQQVWDQLLTPSNHNTLMSIQKYSPDCRSLAGLSLSEQNSLPSKEVHKLVIDLIFFNTDRHLSNILVTPENSLVLIDHGSCLPSPLGDEGCKGLQQARYEFLELPQCESSLDPYFAGPLANLDIEKFVASLKKEQCLHEADFGKLCNIPEECYNLIRLNLHLLQVGIETGVSVKAMGSIHQICNMNGNSTGGEIVPFYLEHIENQSEINWTEIRSKLKFLFEKQV